MLSGWFVYTTWIFFLCLYTKHSCQQAIWGTCGIECEFCSGCDNRGGGLVESIYQPYIDGLKEIREINAEYSAPLVKG